MATTISQIYLGDLRTEATHGPSGAVFVTDAPVDHDGLGRSFAPTDLLATALGNCALTAMSIEAMKLGWEMTGANAITKKYIAETGPRRVDRITLSIEFPGTIDQEQADFLKEIAYTNPVYLSVKGCIDVEFNWINR